MKLDTFSYRDVEKINTEITEKITDINNRLNGDDPNDENIPDTDNIINTRNVTKKHVDCGKTIYNNWTSQNIKTIMIWKKNLLKSIVIYNFALEKYKKRLNWILIVAMILGYITTLLSATIFILSIISVNYIWIILGFSITSLGMNITITILNIILKNTEWTKMVTRYASYINRLDSCYATIANLLILPEKMREDAIVFIRKQNKEYLKTTRTVPDLLPSDYATGLAKYRKFIESGDIDFSIQQKYCQRDILIE